MKNNAYTTSHWYTVHLLNFSWSLGYFELLNWSLCRHDNVHISPNENHVEMQQQSIPEAAACKYHCEHGAV